MNKSIIIDIENISEKDFDELYYQLSLKVESYAATISSETKENE